MDQHLSYIHVVCYAQCRVARLVGQVARAVDVLGREAPMPNEWITGVGIDVPFWGFSTSPSVDLLAGWWFGTFFIFSYIGNNHPNWLIFFRGVQTTNQLEMIFPIVGWCWKKGHLPTPGKSGHLSTIGGFHRWGYPHSWMVYNGKSHSNGWFWGTPILGNLQLF